MKSLAEVLKTFQARYPNQDQTSLTAIAEEILADQDVQRFWQENQDKLRGDAFERKMMDLYEFIQQKKRIADGQPSLYPGFYPSLALAKGYPYVAYVPSEETLRKQEQREKLTVYQVPKAVKQADLQSIAEESAQDPGRIDALTETIRIFNEQVHHADHFIPGVYLSGDFGIGKTYLMGALANALAVNQVNVMLLHFPSFINDLKASFNKPHQDLSDLIDQAKKVSVLILDDLGADTLTAWSRDDILGVILEYRMQNELTTCFTSNFDLNSLESYLAQTRDGVEPGKAARLMQRVRFLAKPVHMAGINRRLES